MTLLVLDLELSLKEPGTLQPCLRNFNREDTGT